MTTHKRKLTIGLTSRHGDAAWVNENTCHYINVLNGYDVDWVLLAPDAPATLPGGAVYQPDDRGRLASLVLDQLDGLILTGGGDVDPSYFGAELDGANTKVIDVKRDELELGLARRALEMDLPTFGICRGCQVMNVAAGGGMVQHFDGHRSSKEAPIFHDVMVTQPGRFRDAVGEDVLAANTYHHQGMDRASMAPLFTPVGMAEPDDWLVEALESDQHRWMIGVQWHPERLFELDGAHRRLWESFLAACGQ